MIRNRRERRSRLSARPFDVLASHSVLSASTVQKLTEEAFIVIPGPVAPGTQQNYGYAERQGSAGDRR